MSPQYIINQPENIYQVRYDIKTIRESKIKDDSDIAWAAASKLWCIFYVWTAFLFFDQERRCWRGRLVSINSKPHETSWRYGMKTLGAFLAPFCEENPPVVFPHKGLIMRSFGVVFDVSLNKLLNKTIEWPVIWDAVEMPIWRHFNVCTQLCGSLFIYDRS